MPMGQEYNEKVFPLQTSSILYSAAVDSGPMPEWKTHPTNNLNLA
jgi:hypothetical protein